MKSDRQRIAEACFELSGITHAATDGNNLEGLLSCANSKFRRYEREINQFGKEFLEILDLLEDVPEPENIKLGDKIILEKIRYLIERNSK